MLRSRLASPLLASLAVLGALLLTGPGSAAAAGGKVALADGVAVGAGGPQARAAGKLQRSGTKEKGRGSVAGAVELGGRTQRPATTAPAPPPAPAPSDLLFNGARVGDFPLLQAAPGAIVDAPDPAGSGESAIEMTVDEADVYPLTPTDNPRAQALSPNLIDNGEEFWLSTKFFLPRDFPTVDGWLSLVSIYGAPYNGSSPWQIEVVGDQLQWMRNDTYGYDVPWRMPVPKGRWVTVLLHERFASDGFVEMWIDGQPVSFFGNTPRLQMQTMDSSNDGGANAAKIMQYREAGMFESASVYFGPLKLGTTRESVGG